MSPRDRVVLVQYTTNNIEHKVPFRHALLLSFLNMLVSERHSLMSE